MSLAAWLTGFSLFPTVHWKLNMLHVASPPPVRSRHIQEARPHSTVTDVSAAWWSSALRRARPRSGPAGLCCLRQQQWHLPHCETHALGLSDPPTTGRMERSGSRQVRGGWYHSPGGGGQRRRGVHASRAAESVEVSAQRFTFGATDCRYWSPEPEGYDELGLQLTSVRCSTGHPQR